MPCSPLDLFDALGAFVLGFIVTAAAAAPLAALLVARLHGRGPGTAAITGGDCWERNHEQRAEEVRRRPTRLAPAATERCTPSSREGNGSF